jgi:predicted DNA-binding transcriptional regulator AlpA
VNADRDQPGPDGPGLDGAGLEVGQVGEGGRRLVDRAELVDRLGMTEQTLARLYSQRASTGHPDSVGRAGRRLLWDLDEMRAWAAARLEAKRAGMTPLDRSGDPDELVDVDEAARVLGYANRRTIDSYLARRGRGYFPEPDESAGRRWRRRTLWAFADRRSRPGRAGHSTSG